MLRLPQAGRYEMHGLLRRFAAEKWPEVMARQAGARQAGGRPASEQLRAFQLRYGRYYLQFIAHQAHLLHGEEPQQTIGSIQANLANVQRAWHLMLEQGQYDLIIASANGLSRFYHFAGLYREAANLFAQSADRLQGQEATDHHPARIALARVQSKRAFYHNRLGQFDQASRVAQLAAAMAQEQNDRYGEAESALTWGEAIELQGTLDIPRQKYTAALRITREMGNRRLEARSLRLLGRLAWRDGDITAGDAHYRQALAIERERGDRLAEGQLLTALGLNAELRGRLDSAQSYFEEAQAIYQKIGNQHRQAGMLQNLGWVWFMQGRYGETAVTFRQVVDLFEATGDRRSAGEARRALGVACLKQQQPDAARRHCQQALTIAREVNDRRSLSAALRSLGFIHRFEGAFDAAQACFKEALDNSQGVGDKTEIALLQNALSLNHWSVGQYELAGHYGRSALENCISLINRTRFLADLVLLAGALDDDEAALQYGQEGLLLARRIGLPSFEGRLSARLGEVHTRQGQWTTAQSLFQRAVERHEAIGERYFAQEARAGLACLYLAQGKLADAQSQVEKILCYLEKGTLAGCLAPFSVYLAVCQVLQTVGDERATAVIQTAYEQLQLQAVQIEDETLRRLFLEQVPVHQEIARLAIVGGVKRQK
jgi:tetratricopeptide (TPR) repeat protein